MNEDYLSWGRYPRVKQDIQIILWRPDSLPKIDDSKSLLPYGLGRSYGDVCLNDGGALLSTDSMARFISFDHDNGVIRCDAGVCLKDLPAG